MIETLDLGSIEHIHYISDGKEFLFINENIAEKKQQEILFFYFKTNKSLQSLSKIRGKNN